MIPSTAAPARRSLLELQPVYFGAVGLLVVLGLVAQLRSFAGPDMGFLLDEAARAIDGARLYVDLVEMNPPLVVLLNMGAVLTARTLGISEILAYRLGFTVVLLGSLLLGAWLLRRLIPGDQLARRGFVLVLAFALFDLPGQDFGEREHLVLGLVMPYLVLAALRATRCAVPKVAAFGVGFVAAVGFALKPHFALIWLAVEAYLRLTRRVRWGAVAPESIAIAGALASYAVAVLLWAPGYLHLVRLLAGPYTRFLYVPFWELLIRGPGALLTAAALLAAVALRGANRYPNLLTILALGAIACLAAGAAQQKGFGYHFYPALALSTLVLGLIVVGGVQPRGNWVGSVYRVIAASLFATVLVVVGVRAVLTTLRPPRDPEQVQMERLLPVIRAHAAGQPVYVMSYNISSAYPLLNYAGVHSASRFAQLWMLPAAYMDQLRADRPIRFRDAREMGPSERYLNDAVFQDLRDHRPRLLVVLQHGRDLPANGFRRLNYVAYFGRDPRVARILERYQLVADVGDFTVYERVPDGVPAASAPPTARPGTRDILQASSPSPARAHLGDPVTLLGLLAFAASALWVFTVDRGRARRSGVPAQGM